MSDIERDHGKEICEKVDWEWILLGQDVNRPGTVQVQKDREL